MEKIKKGEKIQYLNIIKAVSIFLVVFCHLVILKYDGIIDNICMLVCWLAVPCFVLVNGAILLNKKLDIKKHYQKTCIIYIVNIAWRILYLLIYILCLNFDIQSVSKVDILKYIFLFQNLTPINVSHFYFIEIILSIYLIFPIIHICFNGNADGRKALFMMTIIIFLFTYFINAVSFLGEYVIEDKRISIEGLSNVFLFGKYARFLLLFILGGFLHLYKDRIQSIKGITFICILTIIISLGMLVLSKYLMYGTFEWRGIYIQGGYDKISTFAMSVAFFIVMQNRIIKNKMFSKIIEEIGTSTLGIFYLHIPILVILNQYVYNMIAYKGVIMNLLKTIIVIIVSYMIIRILRKIPILKKLVS